MRSIAAIVLSLACAAAQGQMHKCVDERGKLSYQEQPCAGTKSLPPPRPATSPAANPAAPPRPANVARPTATPAPAAQASAAPAAPATEDPDAIYCAHSWFALKNRVATIRQTAANMRDQGSRDGVRQIEADHVADYLRQCGRFGFLAPDSGGLEQHNDVRAREIIGDQPSPPSRRSRQ